MYDYILWFWPIPESGINYSSKPVSLKLLLLHIKSVACSFSITGSKDFLKKNIRQFPLYNSATLPFLREMICLSQLEMDGLGFGVLHYSKKSESPCRLPQNSFSTASCASCSGHLPKGQGPTRYLVTKEDKTAVHENNINQLYRIVYRILGL